MNLQPYNSVMFIFYHWYKIIKNFTDLNNNPTPCVLLFLRLGKMWPSNLSKWTLIPFEANIKLIETRHKSKEILKTLVINSCREAPVMFQQVIFSLSQRCWFIHVTFSTSSYTFVPQLLVSSVSIPRYSTPSM